MISRKNNVYKTKFKNEKKKNLNYDNQNVIQAGW